MRTSTFSVISLLLLVLLSATTTTTTAHNITRILAKHPEFSTFNHYLSITHLAAEINRRLTITVLAVDNAGMSDLLSKHLTIPTIKNVLSLHVLVDYFGAKKLHQLTGGSTLTSTMFQATGEAAGTSGYVNITDLKAGKVGFGTEENNGKLNSMFVKSLTEIPYNISVLQISQPLLSSDAEAPVSAPSLNLTDILHKQGCKVFADLLIATGADQTYNENLDGGLTVFCPGDNVMNGFMNKYKNLTAAKKLSLLLYHGVPVYQSLQMLKSNNGVMNTLATDGASKYDFTIQSEGENILLETTVVTAKITSTVKDEEPLVVYKIDKVLQPTELFKSTSSSPTSKNHKAEGPTSADSPDGQPDDATADHNKAGRMNGINMVTLMSMCLGSLLAGLTAL